MEALITNIQKFSIHDGSGIRTTVFLKGCPLRCSWCANPEAQAFGNQVMRFNDKCKACGCCVKACHTGAMGQGEDGVPLYDAKKCVLCGKCAESCLFDAVKLAAKAYTPRELLEVCLRDKPFYGELGGVTLSGGECLAFGEFCGEFLELCRENGLNVTFETCGCGSRDTLLGYAGFAQRIYFDVKHHDPAKFKEVTGGNLGQILDNLAALTEIFEHTAVRIPVIYGVNDTLDDMKKLALLIGRTVGSRGVEFVELLPFHNLGNLKYKALALPYEFDGRTNMDKELVREFIPVFEKQGFKCVVN